MQQLQKLISEKRAQFYIDQSKEKNLIPFDLYMENIKISQEFYGELHFLEIILRNKIAKHLNKKWFDWIHPTSNFANNILSRELNRKLEITHEILQKQEKEINIDSIVSALNFGFWTSLCTKKYAQTIWGDYLSIKHVFPNKKEIDITKISNELNQIRRFRNRIFHYEQILTYDHEKIRRIIHEYLKYMINPKTGILEKIINQ